MGLSASQARLLTITARKSDCEYQSMRYSHQKIALSRSLSDISTEYQNSLNQTKLVYDYYGTGDTTTALTYGLMMTPSELNGYMPILTTDSAGKVILNSQYAAAAKAAGIPPEGLGCLPSQDVRNKFLLALADEAGVISKETATTLTGIQYSQDIGLGTTDLVTTRTEQMTLTEMLEYYASEGALSTYNVANGLASRQSTYSLEEGLGDEGKYKLVNTTLASKNNDMDNYPSLAGNNLTITDILSGNYTLLFKCCDDNSKLSTVRGFAERLMNDIQNFDVWDWMFEEFESMIDVAGDSNVAAALAYAKSQTEALVKPGENWSNLAGTVRKVFKEKDKDHFQGVMDGLMGYSGSRGADLNTTEYIGITYARNTKRDGRKDDKFAYGVGISLTNIAKSYLTYFAQAMEGLGSSVYSVSDTAGERKTDEAHGTHFIDDQFYFDVLVDTGVNTDQALVSGFYDSIFNQICTRGWVENANVDDSDYLQQMLQTGKLFMATCSDDGYYYQGNYSTNTYIREVADDEAIAQAEAKYNTEKQKLNAKEEIIDLKMKNLDTEISSLTTEYDTIKTLISNNIEKSFKRYDA